MPQFRMSRVLWLALVWPVALSAANCSKPRSSPSAPSMVTAEAGPVILPYTGGPTSGGTSTSMQNRGKQEQLDGRIEGFPSTPSGSFVVSGRTVTTDANTSYRRGTSAGSFTDLAVGQRVHVIGQSAGGSLLATSVKIQNTQVDLPVDLNGTVLNFSGDASGFAFKVEGRDVHGDASTTFFGGSTFADLHDDARVNVKGLQQDGFVYAQRIHVTGKTDASGGSSSSTTTDPPEPEPDPEPEPEPEPEPIPTPTPVPPTPVPGFNPDPIQGLGQCQMWTCGFLFTATENITVQALGQWDENLDGLLTNAPVGLWSADGTLLASVVVPSGSSTPMTSGYRFVPIAPVQLVAGQQYVIGSAFPGGGAPTFLPGGLHPALASPSGRVVLRGSGVLAFPTSPHTSLFGGGNFLFVLTTP